MNKMQRSLPKGGIWSSRLRRMGFVVVLAGTLVGLSLAHASGNDDHDRAREAMQSGQILPLRDVLVQLEKTHPGKVLEVELESDDGRWVYEIKLLQSDGRLSKLKLDAKTAEVLKVKR